MARPPHMKLPSVGDVKFQHADTKDLKKSHRSLACLPRVPQIKLATAGERECEAQITTEMEADVEAVAPDRPPSLCEKVGACVYATVHV